MVPPLTLQCWLHVCNPENRPHGLHLRWCAHDIELHVGMAPVFPEICVGLRCCLCTKYRKVLHELLWQVSLVCVLTIRNKKAFEKKKKKHHLISQIVCPSTLDFRFRPTNWVWHSEIQFVIMFCWFHLWWNASTNRFVQKRLYCSHLRLREDGRPKCLLSGARLKHQTS